MRGDGCRIDSERSGNGNKLPRLQPACKPGNEEAVCGTTKADSISLPIMAGPGYSSISNKTMADAKVPRG